MRRIRALVIDDDTPRSEPRTGWPIPPSIVVESSPNKYHYYWLCDGLPVSLFQAIENGLVARFGHDCKVTATSCVLRLVGFVHQKGVPFRTRIVGKPNPYRYTAEEILEVFKPLKDKPDSRHYVDDMGEYTRIKLKHCSKYQAEAVAWSFRSYKASTTITIRYSVKLSNGKTAYLHEYLKVTHLPRLRQFRVRKHTKMHEDLMVLGVDNNYDLDHLPYSVMNEYFGRKLTVATLLVDKKRDPSNNGKLIPRPPATHYSTVGFLHEARAK